MIQRKIKRGIGLITLSAVLLTGCGGTASVSGPQQAMQKMAGAPESNVNDGLGDFEASRDTAAMDSSAELSEAPDTANFEDTESGADVSGGSTSGETTEARKAGETSRKNTKHTIDREKIVYHGNVSIETLSWKKSIKQLDKTIDACGGIVQSRNEYYNDNDWYYGASSSSHNLSITMRIPAESFQKFMDSVGDVGSVTNKSMNADNITWQYYDTKARLESYEMEKAKLEELMEKADKMSDILELESKLTDLHYQIESTRSNLENMDLDVSYSTIDITLREVERYTGEEESLGSRVAETLLGSVRFFGNFLKYLILGVLYFGPPAVVIIFILIGIRKVWRHFRGNKGVSEKKSKGLFSKLKKKKEEENTDENGGEQ